jgi:hypothetical protein
MRFIPRFLSRNAIGYILLCSSLAALRAYSQDAANPTPQSTPSNGNALIYIYHRNQGSQKRPCCGFNSTVYVNSDVLNIHDIGTYVTYEVPIEFPTSLGFVSQYYQLQTNGGPCIRVSLKGEMCTAEPVLRTNPLLQLQVEAGKRYYVQYRPAATLGGGDMKLMKDATAVKEMAGLKFTQAGHLLPLTAQQAISKIEAALKNVVPPDNVDCTRQPLQEITVTQDGLQFVAIGETKGFGKKEYRVSASMRFKGMPYLTLPTGGGVVSRTFKLPTSDLTPEPSSGIRPCVSELTMYDLPEFIDAINRLLWEASTSTD